MASMVNTPHYNSVVAVLQSSLYPDSWYHGSATFLILTLFLLDISLLQAAPRWERSAESPDSINSPEDGSNSTSTSNSNSNTREDTTVAAANASGQASRPQAIHGQAMSRNGAYDYLHQFGYFGSMPRSSADSPSSRSMAVTRFQHSMGLRVTHTLDSPTINAMKGPRCGVKDNTTQSTSPQGRRRKRYAAQSKWDRSDLTYSVEYTQLSRLQDEVVKTTIKTALNVWSVNTPLTFRYVTSGGDINIKFASRSHGDGDPFDGPGSVLAHAFLPANLRFNRYRRAIDGDVHLDADERWTQHSPSGISLFLVVAHEIGHSLGLAHSRDQNALMAPRYRYMDGTSPLNADDVAGIQFLYGRNTATPAPTQAPTRNPTFTPSPPPVTRPTRAPATRFPPVTRPPPPPAPTPPPPAPGTWDYCRDPRIDAIATAKSSKDLTYAFRDNWFIRLTESGVDEMGVRNINDAQGMRNSGQYIYKVTAANFFSEGTQLRIYAFNEEYQFNVNAASGDLSYIGIKTRLRTDNLIAGMDDLFFHPYYGFTYVFKGNQYTRLNSASDIYQAAPRGYPRNKGVWRFPATISDGIDAVSQWENNRVYVFKGSQYYRLQERAVGVDRGYPRGIADVWFGCTQNAFGKK